MPFEVNTRAFGRPLEADIIDNLRQNCDDLLSVIAVKQNKVVGHILFSPAAIEKEGIRVQRMGLAPMAVLPECQLQGIGSTLIRTGITELRRKRCSFAIVLGHSQYYPRFGFEPASRYGIRSEWHVPNEAFMILVLNESEMRGVSGVAKYRPEFAQAVWLSESA